MRRSQRGASREASDKIAALLSPRAPRVARPSGGGEGYHEPKHDQNGSVDVWDSPGAYRVVFGAAMVIRLVLLVYGEWQDANMAVKYTDIDYYVYTDAARFMLAGGSPYERATYRYPPLLGLLMIPNCLVHMCFGKVLFTLADMVAGVLVLSILRMRGAATPLKYTCLWLFNPLVFAVSSRGNADVLVITFVLATVWCLLQRHLTLAALLYALCVHFKIYPIVYALAFVLFLEPTAAPAIPSTAITTDTSLSIPHINYREMRIYTTGSTHVTPLSDSAFERLVSRLLSFVTRERLHFALVSGGAFFALTGLCYYLYGYDFLYESLLYHLIRKDNRHNFSVYFYHMYLSFERPESSLAGLAAFLPQFLLILLLSVKYYRDVIFCVFLQTYIFVVFNKVCTAQYFLWYIGLLPLIVPSSTMSGRRGLALVALWIATEVHWLAWAYQLEFMGNNAFLQVWAASAIFFAANAYIISQIIRFHRFDHSRRLKLK